MEASEKPQLPLDHQAESIRLADDRMVIERLEVNDPGAARVVREQAQKNRPPAETVTRAIEIGARLIESEGTAANVDFVNAKFQEHMGGLAESLGELLESRSEEMAEQIAASFGADRSDSVQQQIREMLIKANEHQRTEMVRLFNAEEGANPLADFKDGMVRALKSSQEAQHAERAADRKQIDVLTAEVTALRERFSAKDELEAEQSRGTAKGRDFEDRIHGLLDEIATARGDVAHHVGDQPGETRGKRGDIVAEVGAAGGPCLAKIAFDPKDTQPLTRPKAWDVLNGSLEDRGADYAVLVVAGDENVPAKTQSLVEYEGNKLIVAVDREEPERNIIEAAYGVARARALAARGDELSLDAPAMKEAIDEARRALECLKTARQALTGMRKNADSIESSLSTMEEGAKAALARADSLIADALDGVA
jgi:hypothetical protein